MCNIQESPPKLRTSPPLFKKIASLTSNIHFQNTLIETEVLNILTYEYLYNGGGVAVGDVNNDGLPDLFFSGNIVHDKLYLNLGNFQFKDISESAGITDYGFSTGVSMVDINADGWLDIYVCRSLEANPEKRKNVLYLNNQNSKETGVTFTNRAEAFGLDDPSFSNHATFFDFDKDGDLDLYLLNHRVDFQDALKIFPNGLRPNLNYEYVSDRLYENLGNGNFEDITLKAGLLNYAFGLSATASDLNGDDYMDIYVANDFLDKDHCYLNNGAGTFTDHIDSMFAYISNNSMGCDIADINNDGWMDIFVLDMAFESNQRQKRLKGAQPIEKFELAAANGYHYQVMQNVLHLNRNGKGFSEIAGFAGISHSDWSWAALFADYDLDGWQDLYVTNGYRRDVTDLDFVKYASGKATQNTGSMAKVQLMNLVNLMPETKVSNFIFQNNQNHTFSKKNKQWGIDIPSFSNGAAYTDLDLDGDLDLVVNNLNDTAFIFENQVNTLFPHNRFLKIELRGAHKNTFGFGVKVTLKTSTGIQTREMNPYRGYFSSVEPVLFFGLGELEMVDEIEVKWLSGKVHRIYDVLVNQTLTIFERSGSRPIYWAGFQKSEKVANEAFPFFSQPNKLGDYNTITKADIEGDGDMDFFFENPGPNSFWKISKEKPVKLLIEDIDRNGTIDPIVFYCFEDGRWYPRSGLDELAYQIPTIKKYFPNYRQYSEATLDTFLQMLGKEKPTLIQLETYESGWLENFGNGQFQFRPIEATRFHQ